MKIIDENLLKSWRGPRTCEYCLNPCARTEAHHLFARGSGRVDLPFNLIRLGASTPYPLCECHVKIHAGEIDIEELLLIVDRREWMHPERIREQVQRIRRADKSCQLCYACEATGILCRRSAHRGACESCAGSGILDKFGEPYRK